MKEIQVLGGGIIKKGQRTRKDEERALGNVRIDFDFFVTEKRISIEMELII